MIKTLRMLVCFGFGALLGSYCNAELWVKVLMLVAYFGYGMLNYFDE